MTGRFLALLGVLCASVLLLITGCEKPPPAAEVTLYSSVDEPLLRSIITEFEARHHVKVRVVGDTEATKTTGLVQRLLAEKDKPRADVWWSNEMLGTALLNKEGLFEPSGAPTGLPAVQPDLLYHAFANRARVIAFSAKRIQADAAPRTLRDLAGPAYAKQVGMARPQFGTTRAQMAFLVKLWGEEAFRAWLTALRDNGLRLYDGNSSVVRAIAQGEIDIGLTDTDDVWTAQREGWPVECLYDPATALVIPNTVALIKGGPNPGAGRVLIEFILSPAVERLLAESDSHNTPVRAEVRAALGPAFERYAIPAVAPAHGDLTEYVEPAMRICEEVLGAR